MSINEVSFLSGNNFLHHAFGVEGNPEMVVPWLQAQLAIGPDLSIYSSEQCDIESVRTVRERCDERGFSGLRGFVLAGFRFTHEAQNALLKMTEEPIAGTAFFLVVPRISHFLPTLRSRLRHVVAPREDAFSLEVQEFLRASHADRFKIVEKLIEGHDEHGEKRLVAERFDRFTEELSRHLHVGRLAGAVSPAEREVLFVREYIYDTAASLKLLAEHLAIAIPHSN